jgi:Glycosyl transferase family 2
MTLLARDEADVVDAQIAFHLSAGVDFIVATDNRSEDGMTEILESYVREGCLHLIREPADDRRHGEWFTRMARLAATDFAADWVINSDADEFWWPRGGNLKEVLAAIPARYGIVQAIHRPFPPRPDDDAFFAERMIFRLSPRAPINDPAARFRPHLKIVHRADPRVTVEPGNHGLYGSSLRPLRGWYPIEILHFPWRSRDQAAQQAEKWIGGTTAPTGSAGVHEGKQNVYQLRGYEALLAGRFNEHYASQCVDDEALERGMEDGSLVVDTRLRDALRVLGSPEFRVPTTHPRLTLTFPRPDVVDDAAFAVDVAVLGEANLVRLQRRLDGFEQRVAALERRFPSRLRRRLIALARRR